MVDAAPELFQGELVDVAREKQAHDFRARKIANSPYIRAVLQVLRSDQSLWDQIAPTAEEQRLFQEGVILPGETHRLETALFANIYNNPQTAALLDTALYLSTQAESDYFLDQIRSGNNYSPIGVVGAGGVYGTIFAAAALKENPSNPIFGVDASKRRGGIWGIAGDVVRQAWWRMNSRNRPEKRNKLPLPGGEGNLNSLGAETQPLQVSDVSRDQYSTNIDLGRALAHDNFLANNLITNATLVKVRQNQNPDQPGVYECEYETGAGARFFTYHDYLVQATGLGKEDLGFSPSFSSTREVLAEAKRDLQEGVKTPKVLTFFELVEATSSNREISPQEFKKFGIIGKGDTSRVIREFFFGIGGTGPDIPAQLGFVDEIVVFGLGEKTREELAKSERARYVQGVLEIERQNGGFFRVRPIDGRVVGLGKPKTGEGVIVYYEKKTSTPQGEVVTLERIILPRVVSAAGFESDADQRIYAGLEATILEDQSEIAQRTDEWVAAKGTTIYYDPEGEVGQQQIVRADIEQVLEDGRFVEIAFVDKDGQVKREMFDRDKLTAEQSVFFTAANISAVELAGQTPQFEPLIDPEFDPEIPVAEKAQGYQIYKIGAATNLPITEAERRQTPAYEKVPENSKSIFRFVRRTIAFARSLARDTQPVAGALNLQKYNPAPLLLSEYEDGEKTKELVIFDVDPKANAQKLPKDLSAENLLKLLALSELNCIFPEGVGQIRFGVKRVEDRLSIELNPPLPGTDDWAVVDRFVQLPLVQRLLLQLTLEKDGLGEVTIGINGEGNNRRVDIRRTSLRTVKRSRQSGNQEFEEFNVKYPQIA